MAVLQFSRYMGSQMTADIWEDHQCLGYCTG